MFSSGSNIAVNENSSSIEDGSNIVLEEELAAMPPVPPSRSKFAIHVGLTVLAAVAHGTCSTTDQHAYQPLAVHRVNAAAMQDQPGTPFMIQNPPMPGSAREVSLPSISRSTLENGLEVNVVPLSTLPVVNLLLVVRSGDASDPVDMPGLSHITAAMLKEGSRKHSSTQLAQAVESIGAYLDVTGGPDSVLISLRVLSNHLDTALGLLSEIATQPAFSGKELEKLRKRELDRLLLQSQDPQFLAAREFYKRLYGSHPYAHTDTTPEALSKIKTADLQTWHKNHVVPRNSRLIVVGKVQPQEIQKASARLFSSWKGGDELKQTYPRPPSREQREIVVLDRPDSVQSVIVMGNLALPRNHPDYLPLKVANQVLGGSAASRLFMDLREKRSLTYGAYSSVGSRADVAPFVAQAAVRTEVTQDAVQAFLEHLEKISRTAPPQTELGEAKRYLSDSFPLRIETTQKITSLIGDLRVFNLPDDYWDTFRKDIRKISADGALKAAQTYIKPQQALVVVVGNAQKIEDSLRKFGKVSVIKP